MMLFPLPPKPRYVIPPEFLNPNKNENGKDGVDAVPGQRYELGQVVHKEFEDPITGKMKMFEGTIKEYFSDEQLYHIEFEDGDSEDMAEEEVSSCVGRSSRRKTVNYSELDVDKDGNISNSTGRKRKSNKKGSKTTKKKRKGTNSSVSTANSDERIQWYEIDLNLDTSASVKNKRMVDYRKACEKVKGWLDDVDNLALPANLLDRLLNELGGPDEVAELTGRKKRQVKRFDKSKGKYVVSYEKRKGAGRFDQINVEERNNFQSGKKHIAILSEAASTGISLQADKRVGNQKRRVHITLELPWSADKAIQQLGRTHRANQSSGPSYKFLISDVGGEKRFAAAVAKRLALMGALTQGDRRATGQSSALGLGGFDFDNKFGKEALKKMLDGVWKCNKECLMKPPETLVLEALKKIDARLEEAIDQPGDLNENLDPFSDDSTFEQEECKMMKTLLVDRCPHLAEQRVKAIGEGKSVVKYLEKLADGTETKETIKPKIDDEVKAAMEAGLNFNVLCFLWLLDVGVTDDPRIDVPKFLNRILGMNILKQQILFEHFMKHLQEQVDNAKRGGTYNQGIKTITGRRVTTEELKKFCVEKTEHGEERYAKLYLVTTDRGMDYETALKLYNETKENEVSTVDFALDEIKSGFYINRPNKKVTRMLLIINQGHTSDKCVVIRPNDGKKTLSRDQVRESYFCRDQSTYINNDEAMKMWKEEFKLADCSASKKYQQHCKGRHAESYILTGFIVPILNKIIGSITDNNSNHHSMPNVVRVENKEDEEDGDGAKVLIGIGISKKNVETIRKIWYPTTCS